MEHIDIIINRIIDNFDFAYMLSVNVLTFLMIKTHDFFNGTKKVSTIVKRVYLMVSIMILGIIYYECGAAKFNVLINSAILAPVFWGWFAYPILNKLGIKYKQNID